MINDSLFSESYIIINQEIKIKGEGRFFAEKKYEKNNIKRLCNGSELGVIHYWGNKEK